MTANRSDHDPELSRITRRNMSDWEVVPDAEGVKVASKLGAMISVRFEAEIATLVRRAAKLAGLSQSEFVRRAAETQARRLLAPEPVRIPTREESTAALVWNPSEAGGPTREEVVTGIGPIETEFRPPLRT